MSSTVSDFIVDFTAVAYDMMWHYGPIGAVLVVGCIVAWRRRRRHPQVTRCLCLALVGFMLLVPAFTFVGALIAMASRTQQWSSPFTAFVLGSLTVVETVTHMLLWGLAIVAALGWRRDNTNAVAGST